MNYEIVRPPNTKDAQMLTYGKITLVVLCPHCQTIHHHPPEDMYKFYVLAKCGRGYYVITTEPPAAAGDARRGAP